MTPTPTPEKDIQIASVYHDPLAVGRERVLVMRHYPRGVPILRPDGAISFDLWLRDAAPSKELLSKLRMRLEEVWEPYAHGMVRAQFMIDYIQEVSTRLVDEVVFYDPAPTAKGWERDPREVKPLDGVRVTVLDWLLHTAEWMKLTLLCHEPAPADPEEEARGLYCHRAALYKLLTAPDVDSVLQHYKRIEEEEIAKIKESHT